MSKSEEKANKKILNPPANADLGKIAGAAQDEEREGAEPINVAGLCQRWQGDSRTIDRRQTESPNLISKDQRREGATEMWAFLVAPFSLFETKPDFLPCVLGPKVTPTELIEFIRAYYSNALQL